MYLKNNGGIVIGNERSGYELCLDSSRIVKESEKTMAGISHAHSDHLRNHKARVIVTPQTKDLSVFSLDAVPLEYGKEYGLDGMSITLHNANHILGSAQFQVTDGNNSIAYTGDFRMAESAFYKSCEVLKSDVLIIESTYGLPVFKFPSIEKITDELHDWIKKQAIEKKNIVLGGYSLGKSQEIIKILNEIGIIPVVHPKIFDFTEIYNNYGKRLKCVNSATAEGKEMIKNTVTIFPQHLVKEELIHSIEKAGGKKVASAIFTGWGATHSFKSKGIDHVFLLSNHADYRQLMDYVEKANPSKVFTVHGYERELAARIRSTFDIPARPLMSKQTILDDF